MGELPTITIHRSVLKGLRAFDADRFRWLDEASAAGPLAALRMGPVKLYVVTDAELARTMLVTDQASWQRPPALLSPIRLAVGENLFTAPEKLWSRLQPAAAPSFRRRALEARVASMHEIIDEEVSAIGIDRETDLELATGRIALRLAAWVLLGDRLDPTRAEEIASHQRQAVAWVSGQLGRMTGFLPFAFGERAREMRRHRAVLDAYADEVIDRAMKSGDADDDVLGALLHAEPAGKRLTPEELRGQVLGLFLAGNETTAAALSWTLVHAARSPAAWDDVRADPERWTNPFVTESLRLTPAVWGIPRVATKGGMSLTAHGVTTRVRRSEVVTISLRGINRDPALWADPLTFDPARFEHDDKEQQRALIPFGLGPRGCIGQHLALAEMHAVVPALARLGHVALDHDVTEDPRFALRMQPALTGRFTAAADERTARG